MHNDLVLALLGPIEFSIKFDTVKWMVHYIYIEGLQVIISKTYIVFLSLKIDFVGSSLLAKEHV